MSVVDQDVLALLKVQQLPVTSATLARQLGVHVQTMAAALSRLEDVGQARAVSSGGQPRGSSGQREWVVT